MKLRTDTIGHFENPTEDNIRNAIAHSEEGAREGDIFKLISDEGHFICVWIGQRSVRYRLNAVSLTGSFVHEEESFLFNPMFSWEFSIRTDGFRSFDENSSQLFDKRSYFFCGSFKKKIQTPKWLDIGGSSGTWRVVPSTASRLNPNHVSGLKDS